MEGPGHIAQGVKHKDSNDKLVCKCCWIPDCGGELTGARDSMGRQGITSR